MNITDVIKNAIYISALDILTQIGYQEPTKIILIDDIKLEHPRDISHGDFATNFAMSFFAKEKAAAKKRIEEERGKKLNTTYFSWGGTAGLYTNSTELAQLLSKKISEKKLPVIASVSVAGPGFINIKLSGEFFESNIQKILRLKDLYGHNVENEWSKVNQEWSGKKILVEHSSPNLFKPFHIGHMMNNTVGESMTRLCRTSGAEVTMISYPSDVSLGIGKAVWQLLQYGVEKLDEYTTLEEKMKFLGQCYAEGTQAYADNENIEPRVREITQDIYEHRDTNAYDAYKIGRDLNLEYFIKMTARLGSAFDGFVFESEAGVLGKEIVKKNTPSVYTQSNDAYIFEPTDSDLEKNKSLHTRVFINKDGNPTYEAKDTGLLQLKFDRYNPDLSIFITDSEQGPYFEVVGTAAGKVNKNWQEKTIHKTHGRMSFQGEKMSSRLGNTPIVSDILDAVNEEVYARAGERKLSQHQADMISIAAVKYAVLRTQAGKNINFDPETSLSFEGDSGPYLQYTYARSGSMIRKALDLNIDIDTTRPDSWETTDIERYLYRYPIMVEQAFKDLAPHTVVTYITELAQLFNSWYAQGKIVDVDDKTSAYKLAITDATSQVIKNGLWILGIESPSEM